jgi:hypothetical protein
MIMHTMFWPAVLLLGTVASLVAAVGEWRIYRRSGERGHLWGACGSLILSLLLALYLIGPR